MSFRKQQPHPRPKNAVHRENIKSLRRPDSMLSEWKNTLKERCLENARNKRMLVHLQKRRAGGGSIGARTGHTGGGYPLLFSPATKDADMDIPTSTLAPEDTARQLVEEQLRFNRVRVLPSLDPSASNHASALSIKPHSPLRTNSIDYTSFPTHSLSASSSMIHTPAPLGYTAPPPTTTAINYPVNTNLFPSQQQQQQQQIGEGGEINFISEDELYELMEEVEEELKKQAQALADEEIFVMEAEQAQENLIMQAQIDEYERWHDQTST